MQTQTRDTSAEWAVLVAACGVLGIAAAALVGAESLALADIIASVMAETGPKIGG